MKRIIVLLLIIISTSCLILGLTGCTSDTTNAFDRSIPNVKGAGRSTLFANRDGWYMTLYDEFDNGLGDNWCHVENTLRRDEYWCDSQLSVSDGLVHVNAIYENEHKCDKCGGHSGYFTSGIITCDTTTGERVPIFEQAYGYFECRVKVPNSPGMWSAFWLQTSSIRHLGNEGRDGSEIDIYESVFYNEKTLVGNAVIYDGYGKEYRDQPHITDVGVNTYEGFHTYALKWTPDEYTFYFDGDAIWSTDFGGVCRVPAFIMLTSEIRREGTHGAHGYQMGSFEGDEFLIDYVKVYQNKNYLPYIQSIEDFD